MGIPSDVPSDLTGEEILRLFPAQTPPLPPNTFELGLIMGGTVSAGAYTAGAIDFLIEALDAWYEVRAQEASLPPERRTAPTHDLRLSIAAGASGGGVCAAALARMLAFDVPHIKALPADLDPQADVPVSAGNPLYDLWVRGFTFDRLTSDQDFQRQKMPLPPDDDLDPAKGVLSLLDASLIDDLAQALISFTGPPKIRPYVTSPFRVALSLSNLRGIPYDLAMTGDSLGESFVSHADFGRFAVEVPGAAPGVPRREDELPVAGPDDVPGWRKIRDYGRSTGAFPIGFRSRTLTRPLTDYRYRVAVLPQDDGTAKITALRPLWDALRPGPDQALPAEYSFATTDGGAHNNEPITLAHTWLAGYLERNDRNAATATRAMWLIDPFASPPELGPSATPDLFHFIGALVNDVVQGGRYATADLKLFSDPDVYSRFLLTATGPGKNGTGARGGDAIAGSLIAALGGFIHEKYRRHDYLLGRANCQAYLENELLIDANNPVVRGWPGATKPRFQKTDGTRTLMPLIPLFGPAQAAQPIPAWPRPNVTADQLKSRIEFRLDALLSGIGDDYDLPWWAKTGLWLVKQIGSGTAAAAMADSMWQTLHDNKLA
ncbi:MAG TPA: hypothetical protein VMH36_13715 [Alphaproteobacteria bacterium]|nr:hypothetical protein [Alphaproteobacteria bacterium]